MSELQTAPECKGVQPELNAYIDGELPPAERTAVAQHLDGCAACRAEVELLRLVTGSLRLAPRPEPSEGMRQRLLAHVIAELPMHRMTLFCRERHGDRVVERREVQLLREPVLSSSPQPAAVPWVGPIVQRYRQESTYRPNCCQIVESHSRREYHE